MESGITAAPLMLKVAVWCMFLVMSISGYIGAFVGWPAIVCWVYKHETLTAGLLALISALVGSWFLYQQTSMSDRHERDRRLRRREAVRTVLPLSLSSVCEYASYAAAATKQLLDQCDSRGDLPARASLVIPTLPVLPQEAIGVMRELVESVDVAETRVIAGLVADIQVQNSRLSSSIADAGSVERISSAFNYEEYLLDCARIYARASSLFDFARRKDDHISPNMRWSDIKSALRLFGVYDENYQRLMETLNRRSGGNLNNIVSERWGSLGN